MLEDIKFMDDFTINKLSENMDSLRSVLNKADEVVVDISGVKKVDVAALQMLIAAQKECRNRGKNITFKISNEISNFQSLTGIRFDAC